MPSYTAYGTRTVDGEEREFKMPNVEGNDKQDARDTFNQIVSESDKAGEIELDQLE